MRPAPAGLFERLATLEGYRRSFQDPKLWRPVVRAVCQAHGLSCRAIRPGTSGTFPTFLVDERWAVKFFGPLFTGETCWLAELEAAAVMKGLPELPVPGLLASGTLARDEDWHYIIFTAAAGVSLASLRAQIPAEGRREFASWLGGIVQRMHQLPVPPGSTLPRLAPARCVRWLSARWDEDRRRWPNHLAAQVEAYLSEHQALLPGQSDHFIHADLTQEHFLGEIKGGHWETRAVIDFGDAMLGNLYYELAALHLDLFACDKVLLAAFLEAYGFDPVDWQAFETKAMVSCLMHQFDVVGHLFEWQPELRKEGSLASLARTLWNPEQPGLRVE